MGKKAKLQLASIVLFFLLFGMVGCTMVKILARGNQPIILNTLPEKYTVLGHFKKSKGIVFDYTRSPDISAIIREATAPYPDADAVVNAFITVESSVGDFFFNFFTLGFANAFTITVEGDVIRYQK